MRGPADQEVRAPEPEVPAAHLRFRKLLKPFLRGTWRSERFGCLGVTGDPSSGCLQVEPLGWPDPSGCPDAPTSATAAPRTLRVDGNRIWLEGPGGPDASRLRLLPGESHPGARAVWEAPGGEREVWSQTCQGAQPGTEVPARAGAPAGGGEVVLHAGEDANKKVLQAGKDAMGDKRFDEAMALFSALIKSGDTFVLHALQERAHLHVLMRAPAAARADAEQAVKLQPGSYLSHQALGLARLAGRDYAGAKEAYQAAQKMAPHGVHAIGYGLWESERLLLMSEPVKECSRTFFALRWQLDALWCFCNQRYGGAGGSTPAPIRQFALQFTSSRRAGVQMPYLLTMPAMPAQDTRGAGTAPQPQRQYPLLVYLHSAASTDICKGEVLNRQMQFLAQEAPHATYVDHGQPGLVDEFIGVAPCCPCNLAALAGDTPKACKRHKIYWFKTCETFAYANWDFSQATRCVEIELLVIELLAHVCQHLPVDPSRIYFVGSSCGGYGVLRLGELVPRLPAAIVPIAGYYPEIRGHDHDVSTLVEKLHGVNVWPLHCERDKLCRLDLPHVQQLYKLLRDRNHVQVDWVAHNVARGSQSNYHSAHKRIFENPDAFFEKLLGYAQPKMLDATKYLRQRLAELWAELAPVPSGRYER